jgi:sulfhydrogenase subunit gamma (sulfur reductase)
MTGMTDLNHHQQFPADGNIYLPHIAIIEKIVDETYDTRTFHFNFKDEKLHREFAFESGQFAEYSVFGTGEATFCISSSPTRRDYLECCVRRVGKVTNALHRLSVGAEIGFRGPYGNSFPLDFLRRKNLVFVAGGIGLAPLRSLIWNVLDNRDQYDKVDIIYGARSPADLCFTYDLETWANNPTVNMVTTVDKEGFVPAVTEQTAPSSHNAIAIVCGPPVMIRFTFPVLEKLGFTPDRMLTTLEKRMKCGVGKCGRCNIGNLYVCRDGPVFSYAQIKGFLSKEY